MRWRMENEWWGALTGIHNDSTSQVQRAPKNLLCCIALYLNFLAKLPETKALDSIVVICALPFNETGLFHQI